MLPNDIITEKLRTLPQRLRQSIVGQDAAVNIVCERLQHGELGLTSPGRPKASFLFLGPTGVGKTALTLHFTEELLGPGKVVRLDMSEYQTKKSVAVLLGESASRSGRIAAGYDACQGVGTLLCDEIEKAHPEVLDLLLQLLDAARLTTGENRTLDFSSWYVVLTSNIGAQRIMALRKSKYETMERLVRQDAQRELRPELFARITAAIVFDKLNYDVQCRVAEGMLQGELRAQLARGYAMTSGTGVREIVLKHGYSERLGARPMRDAIERLVRNALSENLLSGGRGVGLLQGHPAGTKLELLPAASAAVAA
jgi:ATP-dependent Clp protease ATP-binding subunit ClpA